MKQWPLWVLSPAASIALAGCGAKSTLVLDLEDSGSADAGPACGDGHVGSGEECDGADLGGSTCTSMGFPSGTLRCAADCTLDSSECSNGDDLLEGLIAYYPFAGNADDMSGSDRHGIVHGAVLTTDRFGIAGRAYLFGGEDDRIDIGEGMLSGLEDWTIAAWMYCTEPDMNGQSIYSEIGLGRGSQNVTFMVDRGRLDLYLDTLWVNDQNITAATELCDWEWHHVAAARSGNGIRLYVDSELDGRGTSIRVIDPGLSAGIGACDLGPPITGAIDEVRIYDRALPAPQIEMLHRDGGW